MFDRGQLIIFSIYWKLFCTQIHTDIILAGNRKRYVTNGGKWNNHSITMNHTSLTICSKTLKLIW